VDVPAGSPVGAPSIVLQLFDVELHNDYRPLPSSVLPTRNYAWSASRLGPSASGLHAESQRASTLSPGPGMLCNCHFGLTNVGIDATSVRRDGAGLRRSRDPGAGAIAPLHNLTHVATVDIAAGSELFHDYGEAWFKKRGTTFGGVPFAGNYREADRIVTKTRNFAARHNLSSDLRGRTAFSALWDLVRLGNATDDDAISFGSKFLGSEGGGPTTVSTDNLLSLFENSRFDDPRTRAALPSKATDVARAASMGTARHSVPNGAVRSRAWLEENGMCTDNIVPGASGNPRAGRGAFATRFLAEGSVVTPVPLLLLPDRRVLDMYSLAPGRGGGRGTYDAPMKRSRDRGLRQVLLNYCFGHPRSTALLLPYSSTVGLVNHDEERDPNAELRWPPKFERINGKLTGMSIEDIARQDTPPGSVVMELVALRDIAPGEEVTIDYGDRWDRAWRRHVERWEAPPSSSAQSLYVPAAEMNAARGDWAVRTFDEERIHPTFPPNIDTACYYDFGSGAKLDDVQSCSLPGHLPDLAAHGIDNDIKQRIFSWERTSSLRRGQENLRRCRVIARDLPHDQGGSSDKQFVVLVKERSSNRLWQRAVRGVPEDAIMFIDLPRTSDQHLAGAFRHELALPDDMFPQLWMNVF